MGIEYCTRQREERRLGVNRDIEQIRGYHERDQMILEKKRDEKKQAS
jgi:hypothetical protein